MYALIVFTLGWPAPEPIDTFSRIEVCKAVKTEILRELGEGDMKCIRVDPLARKEARLTRE
jgi:hypothetical protein